MSNNSAMNLTLSKFDMKKIPQDAVVIFIGKRRTGKSTLVRDLLYYHQDMPVGTIISGTEECNKFFSKMFPSIFIYYEYSPVILDKFCKLQRLKMQKIQAEKQQFGENYKSRIDPRSFLILDDCMYDDEWTRDKNIRFLFMNGRWIKTFFLITMQYPLGINPSLRTNVDFVFILREPNMNNRKRIYDNYATAFPSFEFFCQTMDQCTQNFECLVIDNTTQSNKLQDCIFWYKAELHPDFRIGAPEIWAYNAQNYQNKEEEQINQYDPSTASKKLRGPQIQIVKK
jgi:hypothetical protein